MALDIRLTMNKLAIVFVIAVSSAGQLRPEDTAQTAATQLWENFEAISWEASLKEWRTSHPDLDCVEPHGDRYSQTADEQWTSRCSSTPENADRAEWFFYAFRLEDPPVSRLEQFRACIVAHSSDLLQRAFQFTAQRLNARYGIWENPGHLLAESGSPFWREVRRWRRKDLEIYLYIKAEPRKPASLELLARHRELLDALAEDSNLREIEWGLQAEKELDRELGDALRGSLPNLPMLLKQEPARQNEQKLYTDMRRALDIAKTVPPEQQALLQLAVDRLADHILVTDHAASPDWDEQRAQLAAHGMTYSWNELGGTWVYQHEYLWRVWQDDSNSPPGQEAFVMLLNKGWDTTGYCGGGAEQFRKVIEHGEKFLETYPESPRRSAVEFALAQAYETWWSLSQASKADEYGQSDRYQAGADVAREKALSFYSHVLKLAPGSAEAAYARRELPRLKLSIDTNQRRYFCIYD
jgi:hypothetical protein